MSTTNHAVPPVVQPPTYTQGGNQVVQQQPVQYVVFNAAPAAVVSAKVEYSKGNIDAVRGLTITQLVLAVTIVVLHIFSTAINDTFYYKVIDMRDQLDDSSFVYLYLFVDHAGTGIWMGVIMAVTAGLGMAGYRKQRKSLIISHLVLNLFVLLLSFTLMAVLSTTVSELNYCRRTGEPYNRNGRYDHHSYNYNDYNYNNYNYNYNRYRQSTTTTTPPPTTTLKVFMFYGETLDGYSGNFYCQNSIFKVWLAFDAIMIVCCIGEFFVTTALIVYNSIAACTCCRKCCTSCQDTSEEQASGQAVSYHSQPVRTMAMPQLQTPVPQLQVAPGVQATPAPVHYQYAQQPVMMMAPPTQPGVQQMQQPVMMMQPAAPPTQTGVQKQTQQQPQAASADEKWEQLPSEYAAVFQNQPR